MLSSGCRRSILSLSNGGGTDVDALGWATAVTAAGGTFSATELMAMNVGIKALKSASLWTAFALFGPLWGSDLAAALIQYRNGAWESATNVNFVGGDYSSATGLTGNTTTKSLRTALLANSLTLNNTHLAIYNRGSSGGAIMGARVADDFTLLAPFGSDGKAYSNMYDTTNGRVVTAAGISTPFGFIVASRTAANSHAIYRNGSSVASNATSGGALPNVELYVGAQNNSGVAASWDVGPYAFYGAGRGLSAAEVATLYTIIQTMQTAVGRQV